MVRQQYRANFVQFPFAEVVEEGLQRKGKVKGVSKRVQMPVLCPIQNKEYSQIFHLIDKGNGAESKHNVGLESHKHSWLPKLVMHYFNMNLNNTYQVYKWLVDKYMNGRRYYDMGKAVDEAAHDFLQQGAKMRKQNAEHPEHLKDISQMFDTKVGRKLLRDAKGHHQATTHGRRHDMSSLSRLCTLQSYQRCNAWRRHQSEPCT